MQNRTFYKQKHLLNRFAFGVSSPKEPRLQLSVEALVAKLFEEHSKPSLMPNSYLRLLPNRKSANKETKNQFREQAKEENLNMGSDWIEHMSKCKSDFNEAMTLFWHGFFACRSKVPSFSMQLNNTLRIHALGNFRTLLKEVAKSAAMLQFLNGNQNRKQAPNENFARELMELFTIGPGNYTETDIKESARAFTGWSFNNDGSFFFRSRMHDFGPKTILGKTKNFTGEEVIDWLLEQPATSNHICTRFYHYFIGTAPTKERIKKMSQCFLDSDFNIGTLVRHLMEQPWFYQADIVGQKIKSPIELMVGLQRSFQIVWENPRQLVYLQKLMGQHLFFPPNVAGWPGNRDWIDNGTLSIRMKYASLVMNAGVIPFQSKNGAQINAIQRKKIKQAVRKSIQTQVN